MRPGTVSFHVSSGQLLVFIYPTLPVDQTMCPILYIHLVIHVSQSALWCWLYLSWLSKDTQQFDVSFTVTISHLGMKILDLCQALSGFRYWEAQGVKCVLGLFHSRPFKSWTSSVCPSCWECFPLYSKRMCERHSLWLYLHLLLSF